jgi:hypothetical protein
MRRRTFIQVAVGAVIGCAAAAALPLPLSASLCLNCGTPTKVHLIDTTLPLQSRERARTVCFSCVPEAAVILHYSSEYAMRMAAATGKIKCSNCRRGTATSTSTARRSTIGFAATARQRHGIAGDGYATSGYKQRPHTRFHEDVMSRMYQLIAVAKQRKLTYEERAELQRLFIRVAENDVRVLRAVQSETGG